MMAGKVIAYKGDDETRNESALVAVTNFTNDGMVEIQFDHDKFSIWVSFPLADLVAEIAQRYGAKSS